MEFKTILYLKEGSVLRITLNRPEVYNAIDDALSYELQDAFKAAAADTDVRVIVLTGSGKAFCSGTRFKSHFWY
jgi:2-(1,2-epoxy-1,2-dihydrophenyl)acetyl-CoA isomerase